MANYPKYKVLGYADNRHVATEWIVARSRQDAYLLFCLKYKQVQVCYVIDKEGQGNITKISKEEQSQMATKELPNTTVVTVDDKVQDKDGTIRPAGKKVEETVKDAPKTKKESKVSEKKIKETKPAAKPVKSVAKPVKKEAKATKPVKGNGKAQEKKVAKAPAKAKGTRSDIISNTTTQAGIGEMKLSQAFARKEQTDKLVAELRAKGKTVRVLVRKGQFAVYYC